ncbi:hypothetical protein [Granulicella sp. S190]|uniref:hypothetical protein n=1 Tax=Granulicella sp. S190 TaxID=1747226 RepID=UPI00131D46C8|nr:hypothetical protein [Granulicella sp. S190]
MSSTKNKEENGCIDQSGQEFGELNPHAPAALSRFAFLIGRWRCEAKIKSDHGDWQRYEAAWLGRFVLDGYAIEDEYRMTGSDGELIVLGMNLRTYDAAKQSWNIRWLNALDGGWTNLVSDPVSEELGGVRFDGESVSYAFKEPVAEHAYTRATYTNHSMSHFTWRGEKSEDG